MSDFRIFCAAWLTMLFPLIVSGVATAQWRFNAHNPLTGFEAIGMMLASVIVACMGGAVAVLWWGDRQSQ